MSNKQQNFLAVGDVILGPNPETLFPLIKPALKTADVLFGQLEITHSNRIAEAVAHGRTTDNLAVLSEMGFDVLSLNGNHLWDLGVTGIEDTLDWLREHKIAYTGVGMNITEARKPTIVEKDGVKYGFLGYNMVGPKDTWATAVKAGCPYVDVITHYELDYAGPGGPPTIYTWAETKTLAAMQDDIRKLRPLCDVLAVSMHKGLVHTPVRIVDYEKQVSYAAIDAGADVILGHHAHILHGIEMYKGKAIFHSLGNGIVWLPMLHPKPGDDPNSWARRRIELFGFVPDPEYPTYPFHPEAIYTIVAKCIVENKKITEVRYIPCIVNKKGQTEVVTHNDRGHLVFDYIEKITKGAGLNAKYSWVGDEVAIRE